jgi:hypothetical protein
MSDVPGIFRFVLIEKFSDVQYHSQGQTYSMESHISSSNKFEVMAILFVSFLLFIIITKNRN